MAYLCPSPSDFPLPRPPSPSLRFAFARKSPLDPFPPRLHRHRRRLIGSEVHANSVRARPEEFSPAVLSVYAERRWTAQRALHLSARSCCFSRFPRCCWHRFPRCWHRFPQRLPPVSASCARSALKLLVCPLADLAKRSRSKNPLVPSCYG